jgi:hypothetical protein
MDAQSPADPQADPRYRRARAHVQAVKGFYAHIASYVLVNLGLLLINLLSSPGNWWFLWIAGPWAIGLVANAVAVFGPFDRFGPDWEERKIQEYMDAISSVAVSGSIACGGSLISHRQSEAPLRVLVHTAVRQSTREE